MTKLHIFTCWSLFAPTITVLVREIHRMIIERDYTVLNGGVDNMIIAVEIYYTVLEGEGNRVIIAVMERY